MNKKQTIIISCLVVLILFVAVLATKVNGPLYVDNTNNDDNASISASNTSYFAEARIERDNSARNTLQTLKALLDDENTPQDQKAAAAEKYTKVALLSDKEVKIENALKAQGYEEALCTLNEDKAVVVVKLKEAGDLTDQQIKQIKDVIMNTAEIKNIEIKPAK